MVITKRNGKDVVTYDGLMRLLVFVRFVTDESDTEHAKRIAPPNIGVLEVKHDRLNILTTCMQFLAPASATGSELSLWEQRAEYIISNALAPCIKHHSYSTMECGSADDTYDHLMTDEERFIVEANKAVRGSFAPITVSMLKYHLKELSQSVSDSATSQALELLSKADIFLDPENKEVDHETRTH